MSEWKEVTLDDVCIIKGGKRLPKGHELTNKKTEHKYIRARDISSGKINFDSPVFLEDETFNLIKNYIVNFEDVILTIVGANIGDVAYVTKEFDKSNLTENAVKLISKKGKLHPVYLKYTLLPEKMKEYFQIVSSGAAQGKLGLYKIKTIKILLPPLPIQQRIASILSAYDDLIENNLKRIKLLEEIAQSTYEEWFVKLRINGMQLELGENGLPEGWERKRLEDCIINYDNKRKPLSKMVREEKQGIYPYYGAAGIIDYINDFIFDGRYLLIGEDGTVITPKGNAMLQFVEGKFWVSNHAHVVLGKHLTTTEFIYCFLNNYPISQHITGAAQPKISQMNLNRIELNVGDEKIMNDFNSFIKNVINQIFNLSHQNGLLKESRDILLPRLMSGKVGV
jgi:type I restriction enzyme S subunit